MVLAMPAEKSGQNEFDFEYGSEFGAHIEAFDPTFTKVLVRYNPEGDGAMNARQATRSSRSSRTGCTTTSGASCSSCWCPPSRTSSRRSTATKAATTASCVPTS